MTEFLTDYPLVVALAVVAIIVLLWLLLKPRQRVTLTDSAPVRPHMTAASETTKGEGKGIAAEAAAAVSDVSGQMLDAPVHANLPGASGPPDDLTLLKGVGPKMATLLNQRGLTRFDQIAKLGEGQIDAIDAELGAFRGRFSRDRIVEQADYLARGDRDGFEARFGKL